MTALDSLLRDWEAEAAAREEDELDTLLETLGDYLASREPTDEELDEMAEWYEANEYRAAA